jgi:hypothetical protein
MGSDFFKPGPGYVPEYQVSAIPYVTASTVTLGQVKQHDFSSVTRFIHVRNISSTTTTLTLGFTQAGVLGANKITITNGQEFKGEFRVKTIFISGSVGATTNYEVIAGLTAIDANKFPILTGSNNFQGVG